MTTRIEDLDTGDVQIIKLLLARGYPQMRIAALFDLNQGRIAEISTGARFAEIATLTLDR